MTVRREIIPTEFLDLTPGNQAQADQLHATALGLLRRADCYVLTVAYTDDDGHQVKTSVAGGSGSRKFFRDTLAVAAFESGRMARELSREEEA